MKKKGTNASGRTILGGSVRAMEEKGIWQGATKLRKLLTRHALRVLEGRPKKTTGGVVTLG